MKKIAAALAALATVAITLTSCGSSYPPETIVSAIVEQFGKWNNLQRQYAEKNSKVGTDAEIGYTFESANKDVMQKILDSYYKQQTKIEGNLATFTITAKKNIGDCKNGVWTSIYNASNPTHPIRITIAGENCEALSAKSAAFCGFASSGKCGMEEVIAKAPDNAAAQKGTGDEAKAELEAAAKKWIKTKDRKKETVNTANFNITSNSYDWKATSKVQIGDCPANSVWEMNTDDYDNQGNKFPKNCKSITPKAIIAHNKEGDSEP